MSPPDSHPLTLTYPCVTLCPPRRAPPCPPRDSHPHAPMCTPRVPPDAHPHDRPCPLMCPPRLPPLSTPTYPRVPPDPRHHVPLCTPRLSPMYPHEPPQTLPPPPTAVSPSAPPHSPPPAPPSRRGRSAPRTAPAAPAPLRVTWRRGGGGVEAAPRRPAIARSRGSLRRPYIARCRAGGAARPVLSGGAAESGERGRGTGTAPPLPGPPSGPRSGKGGSHARGGVCGPGGVRVPCPGWGVSHPRGRPGVGVRGSHVPEGPRSRGVPSWSAGG